MTTEIYKKDKHTARVHPLSILKYLCFTTAVAVIIISAGIMCGVDTGSATEAMSQAACIKGCVSAAALMFITWLLDRKW